MILDFGLAGQREELLDGGLGFGVRLRDDHAFAGGEAIGFHHEGGGAGADVGAGFLHIIEEGGGGGGDAVVEEDFLGVDL